jgi:hypothetical protein
MDYTEQAQGHNNKDRRNMSAFVPLETSIFYEEFTQDPYPWLEDLDHRPEVVGFSSEGMNFCFRFQDCRDHNVFGGSRYSCIGSRIALRYFGELVPIILGSLPETDTLVENEVAVDGHWITERVITELPIVVPGDAA